MTTPAFIQHAYGSDIDMPIYKNKYKIPMWKVTGAHGEYFRLSYVPQAVGNRNLGVALLPLSETTTSSYPKIKHRGFYLFSANTYVENFDNKENYLESRSQIYLAVPNSIFPDTGAFTKLWDDLSQGKTEYTPVVQIAEYFPLQPWALFNNEYSDTKNGLGRNLGRITNSAQFSSIKHDHARKSNLIGTICVVDL